MKTKLFSLALISGLTLSSCATIFTGSKDEISFTSKPEGAKVMIKGLEKCVTPCTTSIQRSLSNEQVELKLDGYQTKTFALEKKFNAVTLINIIGGGLIGFGIDAATGSLMKYDKKAYDLELEQKQ